MVNRKVACFHSAQPIRRVSATSNNFEAWHPGGTATDVSQMRLLRRKAPQQPLTSVFVATRRAPANRCVARPALGAFWLYRPGDILGPTSHQGGSRPGDNVSEQRGARQPRACIWGLTQDGEQSAGMARTGAGSAAAGRARPARTRCRDRPYDAAHRVRPGRQRARRERALPQGVRLQAVRDSRSASPHVRGCGSSQRAGLSGVLVGAASG